MSEQPSPRVVAPDSPWLVFLIFLRLGLSSFGGPIAHLAYFHEEFVARRQWLSERSYIDLVALCHFLPGPASSQVGIGLGLSRAGLPGAIAAWLGFALPSAIILVVFAQGMSTWGNYLPEGITHGLKIVAVAVVAQAVRGMARHLCPDAIRVTIAVLSTCVVLFWPNVMGQVGVILFTAIVGLFLFKPVLGQTTEPLPISVSRKAGGISLAVFFALLVGIPVLQQVWPTQTLAMVNVFYRAGSLVFGGGMWCYHSFRPRRSPMVGLTAKPFWQGMAWRRPYQATYDLCSISWCFHERRAFWLGRCSYVPYSHFYPFISARGWRSAILGATEAQRSYPGCTGRGQCGGSGASIGRFV